MKKMLTTCAVVAMVSAVLAGCAPGQNTPGATLVGAGAGSAIGGAVTNSWGGAIVGGLLGGSVGYIVGRNMDREDEMRYEEAVAYPEMNHETTWTSRRHVVYQVRPTREYRVHGRSCREFTTRIKMHGRWQTAHGTACRTRHGKWRIVK